MGRADDSAGEYMMISQLPPPLQCWKCYTKNPCKLYIANLATNQSDEDKHCLCTELLLANWGGSARETRKTEQNTD